MIDETAHRFLKSASLQAQATPHAMLYYENVRSEFGEQCEEYGIPIDLTETSIWDHVTLSNTVSFSVNDPYRPENFAYVTWRGSCTWVPEHGFFLSYLSGDRIAKVGCDDGHVT